MLEAVVNLASTDMLASNILALSKVYQCTPLELLETCSSICCLLTFGFGIFSTFFIDYLIEKISRLFRKLRPRLSRILRRLLKV